MRPPSSVPLLVAYGERETAEFCRQSIDFAQRWREQDLPVELLGLSALNHFDILNTLTDPDAELFQRTFNGIARDGGARKG